jgi:phosphatidylserine decarboxylase
MFHPLDHASRIQAQSFRFLPTRLISRSWGRFTRTAASRRLITGFAKAFRVDLAESERPPADYPTLNAFFTRRLKPGARPIDPNPAHLVSPVDGRVSAWGQCAQDRLLQIKGIEYTLFGLLRDGPMARKFENGSYATLYLSPRDYHRVHAPADLEVTGLGYMPGTLLPVNPPSVRWIERLYTQNERLMIYANSAAGAMVLVMVGAHCVGSISLAFHDFVTNRPGVGPQRLNFNRPIRVEKGAELGMFEMGSTVVMAFEKDHLELQLPDPGQPIRLGQRMGLLAGNPVANKEGAP